MKNFFLKKFTPSSFLRDSGIILSASVLTFFLNYLFQLYVGRVLGPIQYGIFGSLVSLLYIISVPATTIQTTIAKFVSEFRAKKRYGAIATLVHSSIKGIALLSILGFLAIALASRAIAAFLHIPSVWPVLILGVIFVGSIFSPVGTAMLQGLQKFRHLGLNMSLNPVLRLTFGIALISLGFAVGGALAALALAGFFTFFLALFYVKEFFSIKKVKISNSVLYKYSLPVFVTVFLLTILSNIDIILVKHYFPAINAGYYVAASLLAKVVFFATSAIISVMFPKISDLHTRKQVTSFILRESLFYVTLISLFVAAAYFLAPTAIVSLLFGYEYLLVAPLLSLFSVALALFSLAYLLIMYNLAKKQTNFIYLLAVTVLLEVSLIVLYHPALMEVIKILTLCTGFLFLSLLILNKKELMWGVK